MATTFPLSTYKLDDTTRFADSVRYVRQELDDGTPALAVLGDTRYRVIRCVFGPMYGDTSKTLETYLVDNLGTEFDIVYKSNTYRGYLWSDPKTEPFDGDMTRVMVDFRGYLVA